MTEEESKNSAGATTAGLKESDTATRKAFFSQFQKILKGNGSYQLLLLRETRLAYCERIRQTTAGQTVRVWRNW